MSIHLYLPNRRHVDTVHLGMAQKLYQLKCRVEGCEYWAPRHQLFSEHIAAKHPEVKGTEAAIPESVTVEPNKKEKRKRRSRNYQAADTAGDETLSVKHEDGDDDQFFEMQLPDLPPKKES